MSADDRINNTLFVLTAACAVALGSILAIELGWLLLVTLNADLEHFDDVAILLMSIALLGLLLTLGFAFMIVKTAGPLYYRRLLLALTAGFVGSTLVGLTNFQHAVFMVAMEDLSFRDTNGITIVSLKKGESVRIQKCVDRKSTIDPFVELPDGKLGTPVSSGFRLIVRETGLWSWPQFPNCPGY